VGWIDSDAHVQEPAAAWTYLDAAERQLGPRQLSGGLRVEDLTLSPFRWETQSDAYREAFPEGAPDLSNVSARLKHMDALGVEAQVLFSTWWINAELHDPFIESALARSWNRWMADATADASGRLPWAVQAPFRRVERAIEELQFGRDRGAVALHVAGVRHGFDVAHPCYHPLYEVAQDLDMTIAVHVGGDIRVYMRTPQLFVLNNIAPVPAALAALIMTGLPGRFPRLRWAFLEAGASWLPFALQEALRADNFGATRVHRDWRDVAATVLDENRLFVGCQLDDDLVYLSTLVGGGCLLHGTDYGHLDVGSDPDGLRRLRARTDVPAPVLDAVTDTNARRAYGLR
jgi:predicted TIM-barrel fold metal-dependent hydrolase